MRQIESPHFSCIDLFCGCGGNSWGMLLENGSRILQPILALDFNPTALMTYHWNMPAVDTMLADICTVDPKDLLRRIGLTKGQLGCLIASPPCQSYSRNYRLPRDTNDHRHTLYKRTLEVIETVQPWTVFMENVPEMKTYDSNRYHKDFLEQLEQLGYVGDSWIVDAAAYGVPQHRNRLIYLAYRKEMGKQPLLPQETHGETPGLVPWVNVQDAIEDLPRRQAGCGKSWFVYNPAPLLSSPYAREMLRTSRAIVTNHNARRLNELQMRRLRYLREGQDYGDLPSDLRPKNGYKASYGRLWRSKPAPTLTTFLSYPGSGRFSHYEQDRVITIREALRLQSFDDRFRVLGILIEQSAQVGNAVPPLLAAAFRKVIVAELEDYFGT